MGSDGQTAHHCPSVALTVQKPFFFNQWFFAWSEQLFSRRMHISSDFVYFPHISELFRIILDKFHSIFLILCYGKEKHENSRWWAVMDSCPSLPISGPKCPFIPFFFNQWFFAWSEQLFSRRMHISSDFVYFPHISDLFWIILGKFHSIFLILCDGKAKHENSRWWAVMDSCPSLPISGPNIEWNLSVLLSCSSIVVKKGYEWNLSKIIQNSSEMCGK